MEASHTIHPEAQVCCNPSISSERERVVHCLGGQSVETTFWLRLGRWFFRCLSTARHGQKHGLFAPMRTPHEKGADDNAQVEPKRVKKGRGVWSLISFLGGPSLLCVKVRSFRFTVAGQLL